MCGRYASARSVDDLASTFGISVGDVDASTAPDWNVAPTKSVPAVVVRDGRRVLTTLRWGLVPGWADRMPAATLFNARIETITEKPAFRDAVRSRRCLLPADGWYEWVTLPDGRRVPHYITSVDGGVVALAGVWERWTDSEGRELTSAAIVTRAAPPELRHLHGRAPVVVAPDLWWQWLDPDDRGAELVTELGVAPPPPTQAWPVGRQVGDVGAAGPALAAPVQVDEQPSLF